MSLRRGQMLSHYRLLEKIGEGGMGVVWKALDTRLERMVSIKVLAEPSAADPATLHRFEQEAKAVAALSHPNIVAIHDFGSEAGRAYAVAELLEGETLRTRLQRGPLPTDGAVALALEIARGLAAAHARGINHGDLKPGNVFLTTEGRAKIIDFGLARQISLSPGSEADTLSLDTQVGVLLGTLGTLSPEQLRGRRPDPRSDLFAFGVLLYEMLSGNRPFPGESAADIISAVLKEEPVPLSVLVSGVPPALADLVERCLEKDPDRRPGAAEEIVPLLQSLKAGGTAGRPAPSPRRPALPDQPSIAVLPFADMSPARDQQYFCEGMADEIINALSEIGGLRVAARTSTFALDQKTLDVKSIGQALKVGRILEGSVRTAGDRLRVTARLVDAADGYDLWSASYDRETKDVFAIQHEISRSVAAALQVKMAGPAAKAPPPPSARRLEAYHLYLQGRFHRYSKNDYERALPYFEQAVAREPAHVLARARLAEVCLLRGLYGALRPREAASRARAEIDAALAMQPESSEALEVSALLRLFQDRDWAVVEREFRRAIEVNPENVQAHAWYGILLSLLGRQEEANAAARTAQEIDPLSPYANAMAGLVFLNGRQLEPAMDQYGKAHRVDPENVLALWGCGVALVAGGRMEEGIRMLERSVVRSGGARFHLGLLGWALATAGRAIEARRVRERVESLSGAEPGTTFGLIWLEASLGEMDRAWDLIGQAEKEGYPLAVDINLPGYDLLRPDPRFAALRGRLNLPAREFLR